MTNGDLIKFTLCNLQDRIERDNLPMEIKLSIYDEIQTECLESFAEEGKNILEHTMVESAKVAIKRIPVKADVSINDCWTK